MADPQGNTTVLKGLLDRLAAGDLAAADELIEHAMDRLRRMARVKLHANAIVARNEQTDDLVQGAALRLCRAVKAVQPRTVRDFINLTAEQVRRELIDLYRHHRGAQADAANRESGPGQPDSQGFVRPRVEAEPDSAPGPRTELERKELDEQVDRLPEAEREVFKMIHYLGMEQQDVAAQLHVSVPTVKRRWRSARLLMQEALKSPVQGD